MLPRLYLITDRQAIPASVHRTGGDLVGAVEGALRGGVRMVQLREKDLPPRERYRLVLALVERCAVHGARLLVNTTADLALAAGADGVHLGRDTLPVSAVREKLGFRGLIGYSAHGTEEARAAVEAGADFVTFSPIFATKPGYGPAVGVEALRTVCARLKAPTFALGGITAANVREALAAGAHGVALISAILSAPDPERAARELVEAVGG
ncbi:MAG: thiamine phosphate synthase [Nitrospinota bacterium]